eukprot:TRINITY_DN10989_c0_g1_i1.p1 TRINITY_DN10989_c0_g1~~TRINITY_DN10989_c0_g1_i1.p1  ORF type:complete len:190 (-),score=30.76 TRINITY_DN10989_c0_g1_i1:25-522(-)
MGETNDISFVTYSCEEDQIKGIIALMEEGLSEPYSIYTYRYFLNIWPKLCWLAMDGDKCIGAIVAKIARNTNNDIIEGYIAMLAVHPDYRGRSLGTELVTRSIDSMKEHGCGEVILETEAINKGALRLYHNLGFIKETRFFRYYFNGGDAYRLRLSLFSNPGDEK